jgi:hypothetical protein
MGDYNPGSVLNVRALGMAILAATAMVAAVAHGSALTQGPGGACPTTPTPSLSPAMPSDVCIPDGFKDIAVEYFDDYSWRAFVALIWPAAEHRGTPAQVRPVGSPGSRVFETYKATWEIFHSDGSNPEPRFDAADRPAKSPCAAVAKPGDLVIGSDSGIDDVGQAGIGALDGPLVAQNGRYVRTLTFFNQTAFDHIVQRRYYLRSALPAIPRPRPDRPVLDFPVGSIAVKSAWVDVTDLPPALSARLYSRKAIVKDIGGNGCREKTMGLVGLHIAQKTPSRPQWIWSSFEQNDLVPPAWPDAPGVFVLNDGTGTPMPDKNPLSIERLAPEPAKPFNVVRLERAPLLTRTELASFAYQRLLAGSPWRYYKLVVTQWPRLEGNQASPIPATVDGTPPNTFPGEGAFSAFTNLSMETFDQAGVQLGCMSCHNRSRMTTDFMWTLFDRAYPSRLRPAESPGAGAASAAIAQEPRITPRIPVELP